MVSYEPTAFLESYIMSVTLDLTEYEPYGRAKELELKRQKRTRFAIMALLKLYKGIELNENEKEFFETYPLEIDVKQNLERCIAFVTFKVSQEIWKEINNNRNLLNRLSRLHGKVSDKKGVSIDLEKVANDYWNFMEMLKEYNNSLVHTYVYKKKILLRAPDRYTIIEPIMDYNDKWFIEKAIPVIVKK